MKKHHPNTVNLAVILAAILLADEQTRQRQVFEMLFRPTVGHLGTVRIDGYHFMTLGIRQ